MFWTPAVLYKEYYCNSLSNLFSNTYRPETQVVCWTVLGVVSRLASGLKKTFIKLFLYKLRQHYMSKQISHLIQLEVWLQCCREPNTQMSFKVFCKLFNSNKACTEELFCVPFILIKLTQTVKTWTDNRKILDMKHDWGCVWSEQMDFRYPVARGCVCGGWYLD